jgi:hypothetical protein
MEEPTLQKARRLKHDPMKHSCIKEIGFPNFAIPRNDIWLAHVDPAITERRKTEFKPIIPTTLTLDE